MILRYIAEQLRYVVSPPPLPTHILQKVCAIEDLNKIQRALTGKELSVEQFDEFMEMSFNELDTLICDQSAVLNRVNHDRRIQGADF